MDAIFYRNISLNDFISFRQNIDINATNQIHKTFDRQDKIIRAFSYFILIGIPYLQQLS